MKKLRAIFLFCVVASVTSCFENCLCSSDCTDTEEKLPTYANRSGEMVKIVSYFAHSEKFIANGDTLHYTEEGWYVPSSNSATINCGGLVFSGNCDPIRMELHFLGDSQKSLIFDGPINNDDFDMRSWDSYKRGKEIPGWADFWAGVEYVYTITPEHRARATEDNCQSLESE